MSARSWTVMEMPSDTKKLWPEGQVYDRRRKMLFMGVVPPTRYVHIALELWGVVFCLIAALSAALGRLMDKKKRSMMCIIQLLTALMLAADAYAWIYRGVVSDVGHYMVRISNFSVYALNYMIMSAFVMLISGYLTEEQKKRSSIRRKAVYALSAVMILLLIASQGNQLFYYFDIHNYYRRSDLFWLTQVSGIVGIMIGSSIIIQFRNNFSRMKRIAFLSYPVLPIIALVIQISFYGISLLSMAITISMLLMYITSLVEQSQMMIKQEREIADMKIDMMLSQIKPHFMFNTLTTIRYLIKKKPEEAVEAVDEFSSYLRTNLESLSEERMIPVENEIEHVKNYLSIEKRRFGERINVVYDIREDGFDIPALTIQPLVENAVKHGITKKAEGGTVVIETGRRDGGYFVKVSDDGVGFDPKNTEQSSSGRKHIGIENVRSRLASTCGGTLYVSGEPGAGAVSEIFIPAVNVHNEK